jgi:hypothetical protein
LVVPGALGVLGVDGVDGVDGVCAPWHFFGCESDGPQPGMPRPPFGVGYC